MSASDETMHVPATDNIKKLQSQKDGKIVTQFNKKKGTGHCLAVDRFLLGLWRNWYSEIVLIIALIGAFVIRRSMSSHIVRDPSDFKAFLLPWCIQYQKLGIRKGLSVNFTDYYVPYNVFLAVIAQFIDDFTVPIAMFSLLFEFITAFYVYKISCFLLSERGGNDKDAKHVSKDIRRKSAFIATAMLYLPFTFLNSALWKQCDGIYSCFLVICLYYFLRRQYNLSFIMFGIAFCFKLQSVFLLPFLCIAYVVREEFSVLKFLYIPALYLLAGLPAILCGRGIVDTYSTYLVQSREEEDAMVRNTANFYALGLDNIHVLKTAAIIAVLIIILFMAVLCYKKRETFTDQKWMLLASWVIYTCYMFLPEMHERYDYCGLYLLCAFSFITLKLIPASVIMTICELLLYNNNLFGENPFPNEYIAVVYCATYFYITYYLCEELCGYSRMHRVHITP